MPRTTSIPKIEQVIMMANDCGKTGDQHRPNQTYGASSSPSSLCHVLFPSRCPPHLFSERIIKAAPKMGGTASSPSKLSSRTTSHRRNRHVFVSSHYSPRKSSSPSASPTKKNTHARKHHRRRNFALNAMEFDIILRGFMANAQE